VSGRGLCASFWADDLQGQEYVWKVIMKILSLQPWLEACCPTGLVMLSCRLVDSLYQAVMQDSFFQWADANWYAESCYPYARWLDTMILRKRCIMQRIINSTLGTSPIIDLTHAILA
jgi:hypothetical protein